MNEVVGVKSDVMRGRVWWTSEEISEDIILEDKGEKMMG